MSTLLGPEYVEGVSASLVREYLGRKGLKDTLAALDKEAPVKNGQISNRNNLMKALHFGKPMRRNKERDRPFRTMIEVMVQHFREKAEKSASLCTSTSSSEEQLKQSATGSLKRPKKNKDKRGSPYFPLRNNPQGSKLFQNDLVEEDIDGGETLVGEGKAGLMSKHEREDHYYQGMAVKSPGSTSKGMRGMSGPISSNLDDRERDRQRKMMTGRPLSARHRSEEQSSRREEPLVSLKPKETTTLDSTKDLGIRPNVIDTFNLLKSKTDYRNGSFHAKRNEAGPIVDVLTTDSKSRYRGRISSREEHDDDPYAEYRYDVTKSSISSDKAPSRPSSSTHNTGAKNQGKTLMDILGGDPGSPRLQSNNNPLGTAGVKDFENANEDAMCSATEDKSESSEKLGDLEMGDLEDIDEDLRNIDLGPTRPVKQAVLAVDSRPIDVATAAELKKLIFGSSLAMFSDEWRYQSFTFSDVPTLRYGLVQKKGGPCGVLASVQAYVLRHLLYSGGARANKLGMDPSRQMRSDALAVALAKVFWKAGEGKSAIVTLPGIKSHFSSSSKIKADGLIETLSVNSLSSFEDLVQFLRQNISQFEVDGTGGVILSLYSVILSRTVQGVISDTDVPTNTLMGAHGYCTQDMVNLYLTGQAASNVFNDVVELDSGTGEVTKLKGISARSDIGFLSLFEHYKSCEVGTYMKTPKYPIWVVCSESHFSILFSLKAALLNDWKAERQFDLYYYDGLGKQEQEIRLTLTTTNPDFQVPDDEDLVPPIDHCIRTKWPGAEIDWNGTDPIL